MSKNKRLISDDSIICLADSTLSASFIDFMEEVPWPSSNQMDIAVKKWMGWGTPEYAEAYRLFEEKIRHFGINLGDKLSPIRHGFGTEFLRRQILFKIH